MKGIYLKVASVTFMLFFSSCSTHRRATLSEVSEALYRSAVSALEEGRFVINMHEVHMRKSGRTVQYTTGSYMLYDKGRLVRYYADDISRGQNWNHRLYEVDGRELLKAPSKKGERQNYKIFIPPRAYISITVYENSNECFVVNEGSSGNIKSFTGYIYPLTDDAPELRER